MRVPRDRSSALSLVRAEDDADGRGCAWPYGEMVKNPLLV
jgi:hypothetical protein